MKTQIIHLEPHDDVTSVLDKLKWAKAERLILVWPGRSRILEERLDLQLIQRQARRRGASVGIVSLDPDVQAHATSLGMPIFEDLSTLHHQQWPEEDRAGIQKATKSEKVDLRDFRKKRLTERNRLHSQPLRMALFALPFIIIFALLIFLLPSARLNIDPIRTEDEQTVTIAVKRPSEIEGSELLYEDRVRVEGSVRIATSGTSSEPGKTARGSVEFTNLSSESVAIPAGTTIRVPGSDQLYFITQRRVFLPAELDATRSVEVIASSPGPGGNVPAGQITAVDGPVGLLVSVENPEPTSGGSSISRSSVSPSDLISARNQLTERLLDQAGEILQANRRASEQILPESLALAEILYEEFDRSAGEIADTLELQMAAIAHVYYVKEHELNAEIGDAISSELRSSQAIVPNSLNVQDLTIEDDNAGEEILKLQATVAYEHYMPLSKPELAREVRGMRPLVAQRQLADNHPKNNFVIDLEPTWFPVLPFLEIQINVSYPWELSS